jgi:hypothetical protein
MAIFRRNGLEIRFGLEGLGLARAVRLEIKLGFSFETDAPGTHPKPMPVTIMSALNAMHSRTQEQTG